MSGIKNELRVGGLTRLTTIDYPGQLAAVVYCQGCPWRCRYCHNAGLLPRRGENELDWVAVLGFLERRRGLLDAVVFSGGEPTLQSALPAAVVEVKAMGFKIGLQTAGIYPDRLASVLPELDWVGLDIKACEDSYDEITQTTGSGEVAWDSARRLIASGVEHEIRVTAHPVLTTPESAEALAERLETMGEKHILIQTCRTQYALDPSLRSCTPGHLTVYQAVTETHPWVSLRETA